MPNWYIYEGSGIKDHTKLNKLPKPPAWRRFRQDTDTTLATNSDRQKNEQLYRHYFQVDIKEIELVNASLYLRRPLLITGPPGAGKSTLAHAVAHELDLGDVLIWPITSRSTLQDALYRYDAIGRLQEINENKREGVDVSIGKFIRLGPLGTALVDSKERRPRVLLIDEIDKCDIDLPNDLLHIFEEGFFEIPQLVRHPEEKVTVYIHNSTHQIEITQGRVQCQAFPFVVLTSNGERELPAPFLRRCLHLEMEPPDERKLKRIVSAHFDALDEETQQQIYVFIDEILSRRKKGEYVATDQLLNIIYMAIPYADHIQLDSRLGPSDMTLKDYILRTIGEIERS